MKHLIIIITSLIFLLICGHMEAQSFGTRLGEAVKRSAENTVIRNAERKTEEAVRKSIDKATDPESYKTEGRNNESSNNEPSNNESSSNEAQKAASIAPRNSSGVHEPFFTIKEGVELSYENINEKGEISSYTQMNIVKVVKDAENYDITYQSIVMDDKKKPMLENPVSITVNIIDGAVAFDISSILSVNIEVEMEKDGDKFMLPADLSVGDVLEDYSASLSMGPIKATTAVSNIKVVAQETIVINGTAIECLVVENNAATKALGMSMNDIQKTWYGRKVGIVKAETYDSDSKLKGVQQLTSIKGL